MELFDQRFVYFMWDENLKYKKGLVHDNIEVIKRIVNSYDGNTDVIDYSKNDENPFKEEGCNTKYKFAYYDPNYECKIAYNEGKQIQAKLIGFEDKNWIDVKQPTWEGNYIFRIKPEDNKKYWVIAKYSQFCDIENYNIFGPCYHVEEQQNGYSRSNPPLARDFESYEAAQEWLQKYLQNEKIYKHVANLIKTLIGQLENICSHLENNEQISRDEFEACFESFSSSLNGDVNNQLIFKK